MIKCNLKRNELKEEEKNVIEDMNLDRADEICKEINEWREKQILLKSFLKMSENRKELENLKRINAERLIEFDEKWEEVIMELTETSQNIENALTEQHKNETELLEEEIINQILPPTKFSAELLNEKFKLKKLVKSRKYQEAKALQRLIQKRAEEETEEFKFKYFNSIEKKREKLLKNHTSEYEGLKARIERSINTKLKEKNKDQEKLMLLIQNMENELNNKQNIEFTKLQAINSKVLTKHSLNWNNLEVYNTVKSAVENKNFVIKENKTPKIYKTKKIRNVKSKNNSTKKILGKSDLNKKINSKRNLNLRSNKKPVMKKQNYLNLNKKKNVEKKLTQKSVKKNKQEKPKNLRLEKKPEIAKKLKKVEEEKKKSLKPDLRKRLNFGNVSHRESESYSDEGSESDSDYSNDDDDEEVVTYQFNNFKNKQRFSKQLNPIN